MRLAVGIGAVLALLMLPGVPAQAFWFNPDRVTAPWCLAHSDQTGWIECAYYSYPQCMEALWGAGGFCQPNPSYYAEQPPPRKRSRYRR
jgi:hypothetical protein